MMKVEGLSNMEIIRFVGNDGIIHGDTCSPVGNMSHGHQRDIKIFTDWLDISTMKILFEPTKKRELAMTIMTIRDDHSIEKPKKTSNNWGSTVALTAETFLLGDLQALS